tara:strand:- start:9936 stop:12008 length:2073 start_codon:yes stop_codon:yes gene_type:complete
MGLKFKFLHFKSFLDLAEIEIAPITLIYGENSSGKSTIIECLRMIRQSGSSRINTRPRTNTTDDIDLGYPSDILTKIKYDKNSNGKKEYPDLFNYHFLFTNNKKSRYESYKKNDQNNERGIDALENIIQKFESMTNEEIFRSDNPDQKDFLTDGNLEDLKIVKCFTLEDKIAVEKSKIQAEHIFNYDFGSIEINGGTGFEFSLKKEIEKENVQYEYEEFGDTSIEQNNIIKGSIPATYGIHYEYDYDTLEDLKNDNYANSILHLKGDNHKTWFPLIQAVLNNSDTLINAIQTAKTMGIYKIPDKSFGIQQRQVIPFQGLPVKRLDELLEEINKLEVSYSNYSMEQSLDGLKSINKINLVTFDKNHSLETIKIDNIENLDTSLYYDYEFDKACSQFCAFLFHDLMGEEEGALPREKYGETAYHFKHMLKGGWYGQYLSIESSLIEHVGRQLKIAVFDPIIYFFLADRLTLEIFRRFRFISGIKKPSSRDYQSVSAGSRRNSLTNDASNLAEILFHNKEVLESLNEWLVKSYFACRLEVNEIRRDIYEIIVFDNNKKKSPGINLKDSGSGLYNMLPIITQSHLSKEPSFIAVEEPEVTLHPKLQIALADFITEMARKKENTYLIETHSEHLILNLLQLIKENKLPHNWLNVYVTTKDEEGSHLHKMEINEKGEFTNPWPGGFFEDRENLLMK